MSKSFHELTVDEQAAQLADIEVDENARKAEDALFRKAGGTGHGMNKVAPPPPEPKFKPKFFKGGSGDDTMGGSKGVLYGVLPDEKKSFAKEIVQDIYEYSRAIGMNWSDLAQLKIECGYEAFTSMPAELKKQCSLSTRMKTNEFQVRY